MSRLLKKSLIAGASLLMLASVGISNKSVHARALTSSYYGTWYASSTRIPSNWGHLKVHFGPYHDYSSGADKGSYTRTRSGNHYLDWTHGVHNSFKVINHNTIRYNIDTASWNLHRVGRHTHKSNYDQRVYNHFLHEQRQEQRDMKAYKASFKKRVARHNIENAYHKIDRQVNIPNRLDGTWTSKNNHHRIIIFKPFNHHIMNKLVNHVSAKENSRIINDYLDDPDYEQIKSIGHNQYVIKNIHNRIQGRILHYKITFLGHNELKLSKYGKSGLLPSPIGIYKRNKSINTTSVNDLPYGITYMIRKGNNFATLQN